MHGHGCAAVDCVHADVKSGVPRQAAIELGQILAGQAAGGVLRRSKAYLRYSGVTGGRGQLNGRDASVDPDV